MSDGPHRTLPMRRCWKRLAESADNLSFTGDEVVANFELALEEQCRSGLEPGFSERLASAIRTPSLFCALNTPAFAALDRRGESPFVGRVLDHFAASFSPGDVSDGGKLRQAMEAATRDEASRYFRQIDEHYLREGSPGRARRVRRRLGEALERADFRAVADRVLGPSGPTRRSQGAKKSGLEDGVRLK